MIDQKEPEAELSPREKIEARRAKRQADLAKQEDDQLAIDLTRIDELEVEHGDSNIVVCKVLFTPGLPVRVAAKAPSDALFKRFRHAIKPKRKRGVDTDETPAVDLTEANKAAEEVAVECLVYPDAETFNKICALRPGVCSALGTAALGLVQGTAEKKGKG